MNDPFNRLIKLMARLPGLGEKSGARLAYFLWRSQGTFAEELARAILAVRKEVNPCTECGAPATNELCPVCSDPERDRSVIMVVEEPQDLSAMEKSGVYKGVYHLLGGSLSPVAGRGPDDLNMERLFERSKRDGVKEVILANNASAEGDATASYLQEELSAVEGLSVSRLARGLPAGSQLKYMDPVSLEHAVKGRKGSA